MLLTHFFNECLLSTCYMPSTVLGPVKPSGAKWTISILFNLRALHSLPLDRSPASCRITPHKLLMWSHQLHKKDQCSISSRARWLDLSIGTAEASVTAVGQNSRLLPPYLQEWRRVQVIKSIVLSLPYSTEKSLLIPDGVSESFTGKLAKL